MKRINALYLLSFCFFGIAVAIYFEVSLLLVLLVAASWQAVVAHVITQKNEYLKIAVMEALILAAHFVLAPTSSSTQIFFAPLLTLIAYLAAVVGLLSSTIGGAISIFSLASSNSDTVEGEDK